MTESIAEIPQETVLEAVEREKAQALNVAYIETATGKKFFIDRPEFDIQDITHALAHICRYGGHCKQFYSVAEHSMLVSRIVEDLALGDPFEGLMHDAAEAYLIDLPRPWKLILPEYKAMEARIETPLRAAFGMPETLSDGVKRADAIALCIEARVLMPTRGEEWGDPLGVREQAMDLHYEIRCFNPRFAMQQFAHRFVELARE